jgi:DNA-binding MarR family transcriptional regulator/GNAT superfamily N-acetyltransferase
MIADVRRFNRTVTQRVGALEDRFLATDRPLGEARMLWEIGDGCEVRALRERLGLDSGYASRLLRSLEAAGLVDVAPSEHDGRVRVARLTKAGRRERAVLDRRSDELARSFLEPLRPAQRERLVAAMGEVERLLTASLVRVEIEDPDTPAARYCLREYALELDRRFDTGFDPAASVLPDPSVLRPPHGLLLLARRHGEPVGCGALVLHEGYAEVKRMWVSPDARGLGLGRRLLDELESRAGTPLVRLDTNGALTEAIAMYRAAGYDEIPRYNDEVHAQHWFEMRL